MGSYDSGRASDFGGINVEARRSDSLNGLRFDSNRDDPTSANDVILYRGSGSSLRFWDGSSATTLGSAGGLVNYTLNDAYDDGNGITVDGAAVLLSGSHVTNNVFEVTGSAAVTGALIALTNSGSGPDITANSSAWSITTSGGVAVVELGSGATINATDGALTIGKTGTATTFSGTVTIDEAVTLTAAVTATASLTITGTADSNCLTVTAGDILVSNGKIALTNDDTDSAIAVTAASVTTGNVVSVTAVGITTGSILYLSTTEAGITSGNGSYIECYDSTAGATQFLVSDDGATTITGDAVGTAALTLTAGDVTISDGNFALTSSSTSDVFSITDNSLLANNALIVKGSGNFTGTGASSFVAITPTGTTTGTALYVAMAGATTSAVAVDVTTSTTTGRAMVLTNTGILTGVGAALAIVADAATTPGNSAGEGVVSISADGLTTGTALNVESLSNELMTSGNLADFAHSASGTTVAAKTGAVVRVTSSITESGTSTQDYDVVSVTRTSIHDTAGTLTAQGSILYLENVATETGATLTDTVNGLEVLMDTQGTGDGVKITHSATAGKALNIISASTTVSDVLITGSGVKANNKASLEVVNSGATAAGGSILRVTNSGTPAAATSYLVDFDYSGATMTNNPKTIYINGKDSTNSTVEINSSGAAAANKGMLSLLNSNTGATGVVLHSQHTSTGSAAASDDIFILKMEGLDSGDAVTEYARITAEIQVVTAGQEDGRLRFDAAADNGTLTLMAQLNPRAGGALAELVLGSGAANTYLTTSGAFDLVIDTNQGTNSASLTMEDGANGDVTMAINGTGNFKVQNLTYETNAGSPVTGTTTLVWGDAEGQVVFCTSVGGAYSITLPTAASVGAGGWYTFIKTDADANLITLDGSGAETIGEAGSAMATTYAVIDAIHDTVTIVCDGTSWYVIAQDVS